MDDQLFTAKDVSRCYPWISQGTVNHRVKRGYLVLRHPSTGTGIPNSFTVPEVVHCAVLDELASLGVFGNLHTTVIHYLDPTGVDEKGESLTEIKDGSTNPYYVDIGFYERWNYRVIVEVELRHDGLYGSNIPRDLVIYDYDEHGTPRHKEGHGRFYNVTYAPEMMHDKPYLEKRIAYWLNPEKARFNRQHAAKGFIRVIQLFELAADKLGLPR